MAPVSKGGMDARAQRQAAGLKRRVRRALAAVLLTAMAPAAQAAPEWPSLTEELLSQAGAALHVDVQTARVIGIADSGPKAEVGAKIVDVLFGDYAAGDWVAYMQSVEGEYVKPAESQRLVLLQRENSRGLLLDEAFTPGKREVLVRELAEYRRKAEMLTADKHVPDHLLRSASGAVLHVEILQTTPFDRGQGNLSATHSAIVRTVVLGDFKPGQTVEFIEESDRKKRFEPPANPERIVLLRQSRSLQDGQMKWWLNKWDYGYSQGGLRTLQADAARVRAAQAAKAAGKQP